MTPVPKTPGYSKQAVRTGLKTQHVCKQQTLSRIQIQGTLVFKENQPRANPTHGDYLELCEEPISTK